MSDNGQNPFTAPRSTIPIVGQAFELKGWFPTVLIVCHCEAKAPVMIVGTKNASFCSGCKRAYQVGGVKFDARTNELNVQVITHMPREVTEQQGEQPSEKAALPS